MEGVPELWEEVLCLGRPEKGKGEAVHLLLGVKTVIYRLFPGK